jgi:phospholipase/carboxylesterase
VVATLVVACDDRSVPASATPPPTLVERVAPPRRKTDGAPAPLVVLLHGIGADENDLFSLAGHLDPRFMVVSVRAPRSYQTGYAWFDIAWRANGSVVPNVAQARETLADFVRWIEAAPARLGADPRRLYLLGFSQGAMMSLGVLRTAPDRLAGVVALSGRFSDALFETPPPSGTIASVPLFVGHGTQDDVLPVANGRAIREAFQPLVRDFTYREYPVPHAIAPDELRDVAAWLTAHLNRPR